MRSNGPLQPLVCSRRLLSVVGALMLLPTPACALGGNVREPWSGSRIVRMVKAGRPVFVVGARIRGPIRLPRLVRAPLVLRNSRIDGSLNGATSEFTNIVDLSGDHVRGAIDLSEARFDGPFVFRHTTTKTAARFEFARFTELAIFDGATFKGRTSFADAAFNGPARFDSATFAAPARFSSVSFAHPVDLEAATFAKLVSFAGAEFQSDADFIGAHFLHMSRFDGARFFGAAEFANAQFGPQQPKPGRPVLCANGNYVWATFCNTRFNQEANFVVARFRGVSFSGAHADGALDFSAAQFHGSRACASGSVTPSSTGEADFSTTTFLARATFANAEFDCLANFDQARIDELDLNEAQQLETLWFPRQRNSETPAQLGRIGVLRLGVGDVRKIQVPISTDPPARRHELEGVLQLVEDGARTAGDLKTANEARVRRLSLVRESKPFLPRLFDWAIWWGLLGYLVRPSHPALAIALVSFLGLATRVIAADRTQVSDYRLRRAAGGHRIATMAHFDLSTLGQRMSANAKQLWSAFQDLLNVLFGLRPPAGGGARLLEYLVFKFLFVVLAINIGDVSPAFRTLVEGVF